MKTNQPWWERIECQSKSEINEIKIENREEENRTKGKTS